MLHSEPNLAACSAIQVTKTKEKKNSAGCHVILVLKSNWDIKSIYTQLVPSGIFSMLVWKVFFVHLHAFGGSVLEAGG